MYMERVAPAVLGRGVARARRVPFGLRVVPRRTPAAQLAAFLPQGTGAQQGQHDGQHEAPEVPMVEQEQIQYVVRRGRRRPRCARRSVQVAAALSAAFLRRQAAMAAFAEPGSHLEARGRDKETD